MRWKTVLTLAVATALVAACSSGTAPTPTATATVRQPTPTATASPTATSTPTASPTATATPAVSVPSLGSLGVIDTYERCVEEGFRVNSLELPRQIVSVAPGTVKSGTSVSLDAVGFRPNSGVEVRVFVPGTTQVTQPLNQTVVSQAGQASMTFAMPDLRVLSGSTTLPPCIGIVVWSPSEIGGAIFLVVAQE
ncbi:MAG: hypothetical protein IT299_06270 [Dehalococcoidia bacterium]|nr:hypothetical protein [Dehalococcoidia bacterium]